MKVLCNCGFVKFVIVMSMTTFDLVKPPVLDDDILIVNVIFLVPVLRKVKLF